MKCTRKRAQEASVFQGFRSKHDDNKQRCMNFPGEQHQRRMQGMPRTANAPEAASEDGEQPPLVAHPGIGISLVHPHTSERSSKFRMPSTKTAFKSVASLSNAGSARQEPNQPSTINHSV